MGDTSIQWTDKTWNPTRGCSRVSQGCVRCYAERLALRFSSAGDGFKADPFHGFVTKVNGHASWTGKVELVESMLDAPLHWKKPCRVFVNSMSDLFHEALDDEAIDRVFAVMALCPHHTFQILTKRPERMLKYFSDMGRVGEQVAGFAWDYKLPHTEGILTPPRFPLPNCWLGVSVEDQATADERIPLLLDTPASVRFVSYEPALGPVDFTNLQGLYFDALYGVDERRRKVDWVIVGGESGPGARPFDIEWARSTVKQCKAAGVPAFVKQLGAKPGQERDTKGDWHPWLLVDKKGGNPSEWPADLRVRQFPEAHA